MIDFIHKQSEWYRLKEKQLNTVRYKIRRELKKPKFDLYLSARKIKTALQMLQAAVKKCSIAFSNLTTVSHIK